MVWCSTFFNILRWGYLSVVSETNQGDFMQVDWHRTCDKQIRFTSLGNDWRSSSCRKNFSLHEVSTLYVRASKGSASSVSQGLSALSLFFLWTSVYLPSLSDTPLTWWIMTIVARSFSSMHFHRFTSIPAVGKPWATLPLGSRVHISLGENFHSLINFSVVLCKENRLLGWSPLQGHLPKA